MPRMRTYFYLSAGSLRLGLVFQGRGRRPRDVHSPVGAPANSPALAAASNSNGNSALDIVGII